MWGVDPRLLCRKHLLGEHVEMHMFVGTLRKGSRLTGYIQKGLVEVQNIVARHGELETEMLCRGMNHRSPLPDTASDLLYEAGNVDRVANLTELQRRCEECKRRQESHKNAPLAQ